MNLIFSILSFLFLPVEPIDSVLPSVDVVEPVKMSAADAGVCSATSFDAGRIEGLRINSVTDLSVVTPNFFKPDYGSRMTSSVYVRGFGSRIDQPVVGMNIDEIPVLNKNCYDFEMFDIARVQVLRGAQSALYGRNTSGGAINMYTLSPLNFQGKRLSLEYGNANTVRLKASHYAKYGDRFGWSAALFYNHSDGFFINNELGENCDGGDNVALRLRAQWLPTADWSIDNAFSLEYVDEGGWAYRAYDPATGTLAPVAYNEACTYRRFGVSDGLVVKRYFQHLTISSTTGYRYMHDRMRIDNDFLPLDYFTMGQFQKEHTVTQEFVAKSHDIGIFNFMGGLFAFYKHNDMSAPVHFKSYGIDNLILKNANDWYYRPVMGSELVFRDDNFVIHDDFSIPAYGVAAHLQFGLSWNGLDVKAGLRLDYERSTMDYDSRSTVHYKMEKESGYTQLNTLFVGSNAVEALELLPSFSVSYGGAWGNVYASARRGFKAGGFNTQLFSDILQAKMSGALIGNEQDTDASSTVYKPETNWTYELGTHLSPLAGGSLNISATLFYIDCRNQQLTVFPKVGTGRMMSNAGKSFSCGGELALDYRFWHFMFDASMGYTYAKFRSYISGNNDYSGNFLPFAPRETISAGLSCDIPVSRSFADALVARVGWNGVGRIYWNEENTLKQSFYGLWQLSLAWEKGVFGASLWAKNLLNEQYNTFYFRSIGNDFFAQGKPLQFGVSINVNLK